MADARGPRKTEGGLQGLREGLHRQIDEALDEMTQPSAKGGNPFELDFTAREARAWELSQQVGARLLAANLERDPAHAALEDSVAHTCPRCGADASRGPGPPAGPGQPPPELKTRVGKIPLAAALFRCPKCRKVFSPLAAAPEPRAREL
jgi:predicted RNA-binding Zn-ribbon protein involved in translation (DUF1610 family)